MRRTSRDSYPEPVEKIELDESNIKKRIIIVILALVIAGMSIAYGISSLTKSNKGWNVIKVNSSSQLTSGTEFTFSYYLGLNGSPTAERKALTLLYSRLCEEAYREFDVYNAYDESYNMYYINEHPNEEITVSDLLYKSFELLQRYDDRHIYLGPVYEMNAGILYADSDASAETFDPRYSEEYSALYKETMMYVNSADSVNLELTGNNKVTLNVSDEYISFCKNNGFTHYIDFNWMRNAFIADYIAEEIISYGYTYGSIASHDGYSRILGDIELSYYLYDYVDDEVFQLGTLNHESSNAYVMLKSYPLSELDYDYHIYENGELRTAHLSLEDGLCVEDRIQTYIGYSDKYGCADVLMNAVPHYFSAELSVIDKQGINTVYILDGTVFYSNEKDSNMQIHQTYKKIRITE